MMSARGETTMWSVFISAMKPSSMSEKGLNNGSPPQRTLLARDEHRRGYPPNAAFLSYTTWKRTGKFRRKIKEIAFVTGWPSKWIACDQFTRTRLTCSDICSGSRLHSDASAFSRSRSRLACWHDSPGVQSARPRMISNAWSSSSRPSVSNAAHLAFGPGCPPITDRTAAEKTIAERNTDNTR